MVIGQIAQSGSVKMTDHSAITITMHGAPRPKQRPRFGHGRAYTPDPTRRFERDFGWTAKIAMRGRSRFDGPIRIHAVFELPTGARGDLDNFLKSALDAINGIVFGDDGQIVELVARKICSASPKTTLIVEAA